MAYEYEIFFSYKRDRQSNSWHQVLKDRIVHWVGEEPGIDKVRVFFDTEEIRTGNRWRQKVVHALSRSKCLIGIWSPQYFRSRHCVAEWLSFSARCTQTNKELVAPASRADGLNFPTHARDFQFKRFNDYALLATRFWDTELAVEFEEKEIKPFARDVAQLIRQAPDFSPHFPIVHIDDANMPPEALVTDDIVIDRIANVG